MLPLHTSQRCVVFSGPTKQEGWLSHLTNPQRVPSKKDTPTCRLPVLSALPCYRLELYMQPGAFATCIDLCELCFHFLIGRLQDQRLRVCATAHFCRIIAPAWKEFGVPAGCGCHDLKEAKLSKLGNPRNVGCPLRFSLKQSHKGFPKKILCRVKPVQTIPIYTAQNSWGPKRFSKAPVLARKSARKHQQTLHSPL